MIIFHLQSSWFLLWRRHLTKILCMRTIFHLWIHWSSLSLAHLLVSLSILSPLRPLSLTAHRLSWWNKWLGTWPLPLFLNVGHTSITFGVIWLLSAADLWETVILKGLSMVFSFSWSQKRSFLVLEERVLYAFKRVWIFSVLVFKSWVHHASSFWETAFISKLDLLRSWDVRILRIKDKSLRCRLCSTHRNIRLEGTTDSFSLSSHPQVTMCIIISISVCHYWLLTLHLKSDIKQKHIMLMRSILLSLAWLLGRFLSFWNYQWILHHLGNVRSHVVGASFSGGLVMIDYLGGTRGFEWTGTCFITTTNSCMSRFPSYNRLINSIKGNTLMLLGFKWLQLVNRRFVKGKFFVV